MNKGKVIWLIGYSGAGKTTVANQIKFFRPSITIIDGDDIREKYTSYFPISYDADGRLQNVTLAASLARQTAELGNDVVVALMTPTYNAQKRVFEVLNGIETYMYVIDTPIEKCMERDPKGLYEKHRNGEIEGMYGLDSLDFYFPENVEVGYYSTLFYSADEIAYQILTDVDIEVDKWTLKHNVFIGRFAPFHEGHKTIMRKSIERNGNPLLILVRYTFENMPNGHPAERIESISEWLERENIDGRVMMIPNVDSVNYGRGVGYDIVEIEVDDEVKKISGTQLRKELNSKNV